MVRNKILVFGDSITYGQRDLEMGGWVNRLRLRIANDSSIASCHVFNMGISGQTSGEILARIDRECEGRVLEDANNIIVIACGINDTQVIGGEVLVDEESFRNNVTELIRHAKTHTSKVIYLGLTPVDDNRTNPIAWDRSRTWRNDLVQRYDEIISEICREEGIRYVYVYDQIDAETNDDGLHPSAEGHEILADIMYNVIDRQIKRPKVISAAKATSGGGGIFESLYKKLFG